MYYKLKVYRCMLDVTGPEDAIAAFQRLHLRGDRFSFNSLVDMPDSLDFENGKWVEDGYDIVHGDWTRLATNTYYESAARDLGFPFPLESRQQLMECARSFEFGEQTLDLGQRFKQNLDSFGHGHAASWCKQHWGTEEDTLDVVAEVSTQRIRIAFTLCCAPSKATMMKYATSVPGLNCVFSYACRKTREGREFVLPRAKAGTSSFTPFEDVLEMIQEFRRAASLPWLVRITGDQNMDKLVQVGEFGDLVFSGTEIFFSHVLNFSGDADASTLEQFARGYPMLSPQQIRAAHVIADALRMLTKRRSPVVSYLNG